MTPFSRSRWRHAMFSKVLRAKLYLKLGITMLLNGGLLPVATAIIWLKVFHLVLLALGGGPFYGTVHLAFVVQSPARARGVRSLLSPSEITLLVALGAPPPVTT